MLVLRDLLKHPNDLSYSVSLAVLEMELPHLLRYGLPDWMRALLMFVCGGCCNMGHAFHIYTVLKSTLLYKFLVILLTAT